MLSYNDVGHGSVLVLLHGFCESKELWRDFEDSLSAKYRVISIDLPGFGESRLEVESLSIGYMAEQVKELLDDIEVTDCVMVGHSLGGYVSLDFAERYPECLQGIGLFHSTAFADSEEKKVNRNRIIEFIETRGLEPFVTSFVPPLFAAQDVDGLEEEVEKVIEIARKTNPVAALETTKAMRDRKDYSDVLTDLHCPVLYIVGKEDGAVPMEASLAQCHLPKDAVVHFYEQTGHMGMIEKKEDSIKAVGAFMEYCL